MSDYDELVQYTKYLERRVAKLERQETNTSSDDYSIYLLASGARTGATSQAQVFTNGLTANGVITANGSIVAAAGLAGSTVADGDLTIQGTTHATKTSSYILLQPNGGNVGVGTASPSELLEIAGATGAATRLRVKGNDITGITAQLLYTTGQPTGTGLAGGEGPTFIVGFDGGASKYNYADNMIGRIAFQGQGNDYSYNGARIESYVTTGGNSSRTNHVAKLSFFTKGSGSASPSERMTILGDGNIGIGTAAPTNRLDVTQSGSTAGIRVSGGTNPHIAVEDSTVYMKMQSLAGSGLGIFGTQSNHAVAIYTNNTNRLTVTANGNVGIGTTGAGVPLHVYGSSPSLWIHDSGAAGAIGAIQATNTLVYMGATYANSPVPLAIVSSGTERIRVATDGKIGIGTTAPEGVLHLGSSSGRTSINTTYDQMFAGGLTFMYRSARDAYIMNNMYFNSSSQWVQLFSGGSSLFALNDGKVSIFTQPAGTVGAAQSINERLTILDSGNIGINTPSPATRLHITSAGTSSPHMQFTTTGTGNREFRLNISGPATDYDTLYLSVNNSTGSTSYTNLMAFMANGNVGLGTSSPTSLQYGTKGLAIYDTNYPSVSFTNGSGTLLLWKPGSQLRIFDSVSGVDRFFFSSSGYMGIGTSPSVPLHVYGSSPSLWIHDSGANGAIGAFQATNSLVYLGSSYATSPVPLAIVSAGSEVIRVTTSGTVGINTTSPDARLDVQVNSGQAMNCIEVKQEDTNRAFINFASTDVASSGSHLVTTVEAVGTYYGKIKVAVNGTYRYIPVYNS